jgi:hypothetical protein
MKTKPAALGVPRFLGEMCGTWFARTGSYVKRHGNVIFYCTFWSALKILAANESRCRMQPQEIALGYLLSSVKTGSLRDFAAVDRVPQRCPPSRRPATAFFFCYGIPKDRCTV